MMAKVIYFSNFCYFIIYYLDGVDGKPGVNGEDGRNGDIIVTQRDSQKVNFKNIFLTIFL